MSNQSSIIWISHRGVSQQYDENTLSAFKQACQSGFHWLETDLHASSDNHIVLCHDPDLSQISPFSGKVAQMTRLELEKVRLNKGKSLLFLDEFMQQFQQQNWVFDIKPDTAGQTIPILKTIIQNDKKLLSKIIFLFWNKKYQIQFLNDFPDAICFPREEECYQAGIATLLGLPALANIKAGKIYSIPPKLCGIPLLNSRMVKQFHQQDARVIGYLPETAAEVNQCYQAGVDYVLSNTMYQEL